MYWRHALLLVGLAAGGVAATSCQAFEDYLEGTWALDLSVCDDREVSGDFYNDSHCVEWRLDDTCKNPARWLYDSYWCRRYRATPPVEDSENAKSDAGTNADAGESDAGSDPDAASAHNCVPNTPNDFEAPQPVWFGAKGDAPKECAEDVGAFGDRSYLEPFDPGLEGCPQCACGPIEGVCTPQVTSIHFRGATCDVAEASTIDFSPPENWDGSCSNNHSIAPDVECPPGSGNPCVQSSYASALPDPVEGCEPIEIPVPKLITDAPYWQNVALSCSPTRISNPYNNSETCFPTPQGWRSCVRHKSPGIHECKAGSEYVDQVIVYPEDAIDDHRSCSPCECNASGGTCYASFRLYEDDACTILQTQSFVFSDHETCADVGSGIGVGSKEIVNPKYVAGSCEPTGGVPVGAVEIDPTNAVTWCCLAKEPEPTYF